MHSTAPAGESARSPWSTEPELPPDGTPAAAARTTAAPTATGPTTAGPTTAGLTGSRTAADLGFEPRSVLVDLRAATARTLDELAADLDELRPLLAVDSNAEAQYVSTTRRLVAAEQTARDIDAAIERVGDGTYGYCTTCTAPIPAARLELRPHTSRCVSCG